MLLKSASGGGIRMKHFLEKVTAAIITAIAMLVAIQVGGDSPLAPFVYFALIVGLFISFKLLSAEKISGREKLLAILFSPSLL